MKNLFSRCMVEVILGACLLSWPVMGEEALAQEEVSSQEALTQEENTSDEITAPEALPHSMQMEEISNARELGGYVTEDGHTIRSGLILRTGKLSQMTEKDRERLLEEYHLKTILDFRTLDEIEENPDPEMEGVTILQLPIIDEGQLLKARERLEEMAKEGVDVSGSFIQLSVASEVGILGPEMYINFLSCENGKAGYRRMFEELLSLQGEESLLFHCSYGKDRTGTAAMLILSALGVDEETILQDFILTNDYQAESIAAVRESLKTQGMDEEAIDLVIFAQHGVILENMENALQWLHTNYGSPVGYITEELGITQEQLDALKEHFLE